MTPLPPPELERRLFRWTGSSSVPRYPFFENTPPNKPYASSHSSPSSSVQDLQLWFSDVELAAGDCDVPAEQYPEVAIYFLTGDLKEVMNQRKEVYLKETKRKFWDWKDFKDDLRRIVGEAAKIMSNSQFSSITSDAMAQLRRAHPFIASSIGLGLIIGGSAVLLPALGMMAWNRRQLVDRPVQASRPC